MIDSAIAFSREGIILWCQIYDSLDLKNINKLIQDYLLSEKSNLDTVYTDGIYYRWSMINEYNIIFVISHREIIPSEKTKLFINEATKSFRRFIKRRITSKTLYILDSSVFEDYSDEFTQLVKSNVLSPVTVNSTKPKTFKETSNTEPSNEKRVKEKRSWSYKDKISRKDIDALDFSEKDQNTPVVNVSQYIDSDSEDSIFEEESTFTRYYRNAIDYLHSYIGNKTLTIEDIDKAMIDLKYLLTSRNVSTDVCDQLCQSVKNGLIGKTTKRFKSVNKAINEALCNAVEQVLASSGSIDIVTEATRHKNQKILYTIVFCGVNGVGKSTTLAKVCYLLKNKGFKVLLAACDTFRSGAVEQLKIHANCLNVEVFDRGYGKNPDEIAKAAIIHAEQNAYDVVLIDTAGRMQDNEPLMNALAKLVQVNNPNRILFVGEALVGNDGVDQLEKFNTLFKHKRGGIDGIILTKYDTVDNKVGAALSMSYISGKPIVFVGTGQNYNNLRPLNSTSVVKSLIS